MKRNNRKEKGNEKSKDPRDINEKNWRVVDEFSGQQRS